MTVLTPVLPTFIDDTFVTTRDLNALSEHVGNLYDQHNAGLRPLKPMCVVESTSGTYPNLTVFYKSWSTVVFDTETPLAMAQAGQSAITIRTPGVWLLDAMLAFTASSAPASNATATLRIFLNSHSSQHDVIATNTQRFSTTTDGVICRCAVAIPLDEGAVVRAAAHHNAGVDATVSATIGARFSLEWLAPLVPIGGAQR